MFALKDKYIDIFTDFGFKKLFGEEANKDILIDFLNTLLEGEQPSIVDLTFIKNEHLGDQALDRKAIFDLYCENEKGEKFIVELQKSKQNFFKDRSVYYSTFPIREQAELAQMPADMRQSYEDSLKYYRDLNNVIDTAFDDGVKIGREEGVKLGHETGLQEGLQAGRQEGERQKALDIARNLIDVLDVKTIAQKTGLSEADILALKSE